MTTPNAKTPESKDEPEPKEELKAKVKPKAGTWSPIDTAPQDGTDFLAALMPGGRQVVAHWHADQAGWAVDERPVEPTHWQPLGPLPEAEKQGKAKEEKE
jgi:hypothetical protein